MEGEEGSVEEEKPSLFSLVEAGDWEQIDKRLQEDEEREEKLSSFNREGYSPLELAAMLGQGEVAKVLVSKGAEVNASNKSGISTHTHIHTHTHTHTHTLTHTACKLCNIIMFYNGPTHFQTTLLCT